MSTSESRIFNLTEYARGAGCGCKIAPQVLEQFLKGNAQQPEDRKLIAGLKFNEDAAVYELDPTNYLISTTDFFAPIVNDAFTFGRIAAANAISDVYAMGGKPILALAILAWPIDKIPAEVGARVIDGARTACTEAGIVLAGGHTIDSAEPFFGLAVNGLVTKQNLKLNHTAKAENLLFLTKPLGSGILSTAQKKKLLAGEDSKYLENSLCKLNNIGSQLGASASVTAMTDVTGFGLLGHLLEMASGCGLEAELFYDQVKLMPSLQNYLDLNCVPDATYRNWNAYSKNVKMEEGVDVMNAFKILPDPQTNGGILFSIEKSGLDEIQELLARNGLQGFTNPIGKFISGNPGTVTVKK